MGYANSMSHDLYGTESYGPYEREADARDGFFRLVVSATVEDDGTRVVASGYGDREIVNAEDQDANAKRVAEKDSAAWTEEYKTRLYRDDKFCRRERLKWERATYRR